jgi:chromosome segregation ATPase
MFTGGSGFSPQLPTPGWAAPDFSQTPAPSGSEIFREPAPAPPNPRPHLDNLLAAPQSPERDALLAEYFDICEKVERFIAESKSQRITQLQVEYDSQWAECRRLEGDLARVVSEGAHWSAIANQKSMAVTEISNRLSTIQRPNTRFPTAQEIAAYDAARTTIKKEIAAHHTEIAQAKTFIAGLENKQHEFREKLKAGETALATLRQKMAALKD